MNRKKRMEEYNQKYRCALVWDINTIADCAKIYRYYNCGGITVKQVVKEMKIIDKLKFVKK